MRQSALFLVSALAIAVNASNIKHLQISRAIASNVTSADGSNALSVDTDDSDYEPQDHDYSEFIHDVDPEEDGWEDIDTHGMMVFDHDVSPVEQSSLIKRAYSVDSSPIRDVARREVEMHLDERGELHFPRSWNDLKSMVKTVKRGFSFKARITWYTGYDLKYPNCCDKSGFTPTDKSLIAATTLNGWAGAPKCGTYMKLRSTNGKKSVIVRKIDTCAGCAKGSKHVDLTKAAFSALYSLDVGLVNNIQVKQVPQPFKKYTTAIKKIYGPKVL
ncbi:hypothetical protein BT69DRAFT_1358446 [Atractiella rhizophila]|nr:hypothetical protein BT69DRAFT_1358446 [Atractiella rhizophila]